MVIWYDKCVWYTTQIVAAALHVQKRDVIFRTALAFAKHSYGELRSIAFRPRYCGQMTVEYDQVRLAATEI